METQMLKEKLYRYLHGTAHPAEIRQIEAWLSSTHTNDLQFSGDEKEMLRQNILYDVQCYTAYPLFFPQKKDNFSKLKQFFAKSWQAIF